jgi:leucyl-tRNA synthetase
VLSCFAPFLADELNATVMQNKICVIHSTWPKYTEEYTIDKTINLPIQVNGKLRATIEIERDEQENIILNKAMEIENIKLHLDGKEIKKVIYINNKILNIIV